MTELTELSAGRRNFADYYTNTYKQITHIGDPFILYDEDTKKYYMYCTGGYFKCWSSDTMKTWTEHGNAYTVTDKSFGTQKYWAPEVYKYGGAYYMVYSAANAGNRHSIGLAKSNSPTGPFTDIYDHPLFSPGYSVIDASLFFDTDGRVYLYYSRDCSENYVNGKRTSQVYGVELKADLSGAIGEPALLATPTDPWELQSGSVIWNEGPCVFRRGDVYYLLYTANYYASASYSVGYATSNAPLGVYTKSKDNPILVGDGKYTSGTGHCNITRSPDGSEMYMVYHSHTDVTNTTNPIADRTPCVDKLVIRADGSLAVNGPSVAMQPLPSGAGSLYKKYAGVEISSTYTAVAGNPENLVDEVVPHAGMSDRDLYQFEAGGGYIRIGYDKAINLNSLWIYGVSHAALSPKTVYAVVNGRYQTKVKAFTTSMPMTPVVITADMLPASAAVSDIRLYFEGGDGSSTIALGEIITVIRT